MEITRNVEEEKDNSEDKKEIDDEWKEENYVMHAEKKEKETNYVVEVDTSDKDLKNEATPTVKEVQFCKGIKRKVNVEDNYE